VNFKQAEKNARSIDPSVLQKRSETKEEASKKQDED